MLKAKARFILLPVNVAHRPRVMGYASALGVVAYVAAKFVGDHLWIRELR
jgi:hypothetical protein